MRFQVVVQLTITSEVSQERETSMWANGSLERLDGSIGRVQISLEEDRRDFLVGGRDGVEGNTSKRKKIVKVCEDKKVKKNYNSNRPLSVEYFSQYSRSQAVTS